MPLWLITDEKVVEPRFGRVRVQGRVVPIPGLGLPARAQFELQFAGRPLADEFMQVFDVAIENARRCQVLGGQDAAAHHSVCVGPADDSGAPVGYVHLGPNRVLMDPNDPSTIMLPAAAAPVSSSEISLSVAAAHEAEPPSSPAPLGAPDRNGYQRLMER